MSQNHGFDVSIPVLTEVLTGSAEADETLEAVDTRQALTDQPAAQPAAQVPSHDLAVDDALASAEPDSQSAASVADDAVTPSAMPALPDSAPDAAQLSIPERRRERDAQQWAAIERKVSERILTQLQGRIDRVLEQQVRDCLADVLQLALANLTEEIRSGLQFKLETIVAQAISLELAAINNADE
ncbi:MAG: hypothetical protein V4754_22290 [Pseudomonadota bacterium]